MKQERENLLPLLDFSSSLARMTLYAGGEHHLAFTRETRSFGRSWKRTKLSIFAPSVLTNQKLQFKSWMKFELKGVVLFVE